MKACSTCKESMKNCIDTHSFAFAHLYSDEKIMDMHIDTINRKQDMHHSIESLMSCCFRL